MKLAKLSGNVLGIGGDGEVYLNKKFFNMPAKKFSDVIKQGYQSGHLLCAVSGGADSMCLLHFLSDDIKNFLHA